MHQVLESRSRWWFHLTGLVAIWFGGVATVLAQTDNTQYVSDLTTRGFIQPMQLSAPYAYVPIGSAFAYLGSPDSESVVCLAVLSVATSQDPTITTVLFMSGSASVGLCTASGYQRS